MAERNEQPVARHRRGIAGAVAALLALISIIHSIQPPSA